MADVTATRLHGLDISVWTVGGQSFIGHVQNATIEMEVETQESRAVQDDYAYPKAKHKSWRCTGTYVVDTTGLTYPADLQTKFGTTVAISFNTGAGTYTGNGILRRISHAVPDGGQTHDTEIVGQGALSVA